MPAPRVGRKGKGSLSLRHMWLRYGPMPANRLSVPVAPATSLGLDHGNSGAPPSSSRPLKRLRCPFSTADNGSQSQGLVLHLN